MATAEQAAQDVRSEPWYQVVRSPRIAVLVAALFLAAGVGRLAHAIVEGGDALAWAGSTFFTAAGLFYALCATLMLRSAGRA